MLDALLGMDASVWTALWLTWGALFGVIEYVAVLNDEAEDTLSEHLRHWFRTDTKVGRTVWIATSGLFFAWFTTHIAVAGSI